METNLAKKSEESTWVLGVAGTGGSVAQKQGQEQTVTHAELLAGEADILVTATWYR